jgi:hypothetical protein
MHQEKVPPQTEGFKLCFSQVFVDALSRTKLTMLNGRPIAPDVGHPLCHEDIITIGDRHFRWEYSSGEVRYSEFTLALLYPIPYRR